jgi:putative ABC transport system ATP-binding protein
VGEDHTESIVFASGVRKIYSGATEVEALRGIDLAVSRGELVAIMGPSGSGKTTLLNCLSGLERIEAGRILVDGRELGEMSDDNRTRYRARHMGFVFQAFNLLPVLTAAENVEIPLLLLEERPAEARRRAVQTLAQVGLEERADHRPDQLSGGEQQRVAIARALVNEPALILADEPTGALDSRTAESILSLFEDLNRDGRTIVVVTHAPDVAQRLRRRIALHDGCIVSDSQVGASRSVRAERAHDGLG